MLIATFAAGTAGAGRTITREGDVFVLQDHGPISAQDVMNYDAQGFLVWANDGTRAWVGSQAARQTAAPGGAAAAAAPPEPTIQAAQTAPPTPSPPEAPAPVTSAATPVATAAMPNESEPETDAQAPLAACDVCGHDVSRSALMCPHCGDLKTTLPKRGDVWDLERKLEKLINLSDPWSPPEYIHRKRSREIGGAWLVLFGGLLMLFGTFMPWVQELDSMSVVYRNGMQLGGSLAFSFPGFVTLLLGLITCLIGVSNVQRFQMTTWLQNSAIVTGFGAVFTVLVSIATMHSSMDSYSSYGYGLWVLLLGCALSVGGGFIVVANRS